MPNFSFEGIKAENLSNLIYILIFAGIILYNVIVMFIKPRKKDIPEDEKIDNYRLEYEKRKNKQDNSSNYSYAKSKNPSAIFSNSSSHNRINTSIKTSSINNSIYGSNYYSKDNPIFKESRPKKSIFPKIAIVAVILFLLFIVAAAADGKFENIEEILRKAFKLINGF